MALGRNSLINGLIQHTYLPSKLLIVVLKIFYLNKKNWNQIFNWGPPANPAKQKKQVALESSLRLHTRGGPAAAAESV